MSELIYKRESYQIIGICMKGHNYLGFGFKELTYKDALEFELEKQDIPFVREQYFKICYKDTILPHGYCADFVIDDSMILEVKAVPLILREFVSQTRNYLKVSGLRLGIIANFGEPSFTFQRVEF